MTRGSTPVVLEPLPAELCRFRTFAADGKAGRDDESVFDMLSGRLRFASVETFNDPFEARPHYVPAFLDAAEQRAAMIDYVGQMLGPGLSKTKRRKEAERLLAGKPTPQILHEFSKQSTQEWLSRMVQVLCLSDPVAVSAPLTWSHYADSHRGVCIHFDTTQAPINLAHKVEYGDDYPTLPMPRTVKGEELLRIVLLKKCQLWSYEHEYRVIRLDDPRVGFSRDLGCRWDGMSAIASPRIATAITVGTRMADTNRTRLLAWIRANRPDLQVWQAELHRSQFSVVRERIS